VITEGRKVELVKQRKYTLGTFIELLILAATSYACYLAIKGNNFLSFVILLSAIALNYLTKRI
jgi:hypothetical protein